jgi:hypothetical protein
MLVLVTLPSISAGVVKLKATAGVKLGIPIPVSALAENCPILGIVLSEG